jgi:hypothetical protein
MCKFTVLAAAAALAATLTLGPANADYHFGPVQNGNQCWKSSGGGSAKDFGYWSACPQPASASATRTVRHARHHNQ